MGLSKLSQQSLSGLHVFMCLHFSKSTRELYGYVSGITAAEDRSSATTLLPFSRLGYTVPIQELGNRHMTSMK